MNKKDNSNMLIISAVAVVIIIIVALIATRPDSPEKYSSMTNEEIAVSVQNKVEKMIVNNLYGMSERDRIEYYVSTFVKSIENKEYEEAYNMLYDDFRKNYFPTLSSFEEYAKSKFPSMFSLNYTNIERNGDVYVLWVTLSNPLGSKDQGIEMNFVVQENNLNDFVMSFTVL